MTTFPFTAARQTAAFPTAVAQMSGEKSQGGSSPKTMASKAAKSAVVFAAQVGSSHTV